LYKIMLPECEEKFRYCGWFCIFCGWVQLHEQVKESLQEFRRSTCNSWSQDSSLSCVWGHEASLEARGGLFAKCNTLQCMRKVDSDFLTKTIPLSVKLFIGPSLLGTHTKLDIPYSDIDSCLIQSCFLAVLFS
jgi:hypothetical protein